MQCSHCWSANLCTASTGDSNILMIKYSNFTCYRQSLHTGGVESPQNGPYCNFSKHHVISTLRTCMLIDLHIFPPHRFNVNKLYSISQLFTQILQETGPGYLSILMHFITVNTSHFVICIRSKASQLMSQFLSFHDLHSKNR